MTSQVVGVGMGLLIGGASSLLLIRVFRPSATVSGRGRMIGSVTTLGGMAAFWTGAGAVGTWANGSIIANVDQREFLPYYIVPLTILVAPVLLVLFVLQAILEGYLYREALAKVQTRRANR